jgi:hypothetical protein
MAVAMLMAPPPPSLIVLFLGVNFGGDWRFRDCRLRRKGEQLRRGDCSTGRYWDSRRSSATRRTSSRGAWIVVDVLTVMTNVMIEPKISVVRPHVVGHRADQDQRGAHAEFATNFDNHGFGWDLGGGLILGTKNLGVRGDRYPHIQRPGSARLLTSGRH